MTTAVAREVAASNAPAFSDADLESFDDSDLYGVDEPAPAPAAAADENKDAPEPKEPEPAAAKPAEPTKEEAEPATPEDKATAPKEPHLPKSRYDYQRSKRAEAEQRADKLEAELEDMRARLADLEGTKTELSAREQQVNAISEVEEQLAALDVEIEELRADGKVKDIASKQAEVRRLERKLIALETPQPQQIDPRQLVDSSVQVMTVRQELDQVVTKIENRYPQLNDQTDVFDPDVTSEVMDLYDAFLASGKVRPALAMARAVSYVVGPLDEEAPAPASAPATDTRRAQAVERNVAAAKNMPPDMADAGLNSDRAGARKPIDIMNMSIEQYEALGSGFDEDAWLASS